jgi:dTDP-4-dehydrorhamnose reductase
MAGVSVEAGPIVSGLAGSKVVVIGGGMIGAALAAHLRTIGADVVTSTRRKNEVGRACFYLDLADDPADWRIPPCDVMFLCAAMTSLADCRTYPNRARRINVSGALQVIKLCSGAGAFTVFLSTNQVFAGDRGDHGPDDLVSPRSVYGQLKAEAERAIKEAVPECCIVRLGKVIAPDFKLFRDWREKLLAGHAVSAFSDLVMAPVAIATVNAAFVSLAAKRRGGIWHVCGARDISYLDAGRHLARRVNAAPALVTAGSAVAAGIPEAERPAFASLANVAFTKFTGVQIGCPLAEIDLGMGFC